MVATPMSPEEHECQLRIAQMLELGDALRAELVRIGERVAYLEKVSASMRYVIEYCAEEIQAEERKAARLRAKRHV